MITPDNQNKSCDLETIQAPVFYRWPGFTRDSGAATPEIKGSLVCVCERVHVCVLCVCAHVYLVV